MQPLHHVCRLSVMALLVAACTSSTDGTSAVQPLITALPRALSGDEQLAATATTHFGLALFRTVNARTARDSNLALSPASASLALGILMVGSEGETLDQVRRTLGFGTRPVADVAASYKALIPLLTTLDPSVKMAFANSAWFDTGSPPSTTFRQTLTDAFGARIEALPFAAPSTLTTVNSWVSNATNARIPKIIDRFTPDDIAVLINATYFKGQWRAKFDPAQTRAADFRVSATSTIRVPTMSSATGLVRLSQGSTVVGELPFGGDAFVMTLVMPPAGTLESFVDSLTPARWQSLLARLPAQSTDSTRSISFAHTHSHRAPRRSQQAAPNKPLRVKPFCVKPFCVKPFRVKPFCLKPFCLKPFCARSAPTAWN